MFKKSISLSIVMVVCSVLVFSVACHKDRNKNLGSTDNPIEISFMPSASKEVMDAGSKVIADKISQLSGLSVKPVLARNYIAEIDGLGSKTIDVAFINSLGYLLARDHNGAKAAFELRGIDGKMDYRSAIIANKDSAIKSLADINGKSFAYTDPYSMAGYLMPLALLTEKKIKPSSTSFAGSYLDVIELVYSKQVDAGAIYYHSRDAYGRINDARLKLIPKYNDLLDKVKIVELSASIPNTPIVFRKNLPEETGKKLMDAMTKLSEDPQILTALGQMYDASGFGPANEADFNKIADTLKILGKEIQEVVPGGVTYYKKHIWEQVPEY